MLSKTARAPDTSPAGGRAIALRWLRPPRGWPHAVLTAAVASVAAIALRLVLGPLLGPSAPLMVLLIAPVLASLHAGFAAGLLAALVCAVAGELLFIAPFGEFAPTSTSESVRLLIFLSEALLFSWIIDSRSRAVVQLARARDAAADQAARMTAVLEAAPAGMVLVDDAGRIVLVNRLAERLFGTDRGDLVGTSVDALVPEAVRSAHPAERARYSRQPEPRMMGNGRDLLARRRDGTTFTAEIGLSALEEDGQRFVLASVVDVTERKRMEGQLRESARQKDEFVAMLAHELRNPLAPLTLGIAMLGRSNTIAPAERQTVQLLDRQARHLTHIVNDLLEASRVSSGRIKLVPEKVVVQTVLQHAVEAMRPILEAKAHRLDVQVPERELQVQADPVRLRQVLENLLHNAAKYTDPSGRITVRAGLEGDRLRCCVEDNGIGIAADDLGRLFNVFVQIKPPIDRSEGGLGLGLAVVRLLVELHGGTVQATSLGPGLGASFCFELPHARLGEPLVERAPASPALATPAPDATGTMARRVLVVDDNEDVGTMLAELLRAEGYVVDVAMNGQEALARMRQARPDVAVLDIGLPGMDGYELARRIRTEHGASTPPLVALTGYGQPDDKAASHSAGFRDHLIKPVDPSVLLQAIEKALRAAHDAPA